MLFVAAAIFAALLYMLAISLFSFPSLGIAGDVLTAALAILFPYAVTKYKPLQMPVLGIGKAPKKEHLPLLWLLPLFVAVIFGTSLVCNWVGSFFGATSPTYTGKLLALLFSHALIPALIEEFCFRHVCFSILSPLGEKSAIFATTLLFAIAHISPVSMAYALVAGLLLGALRAYTGSLALPILFHFANNAFCLILIQINPSSPLPAWGICTGVGLLCLGILYFTKGQTLLSFCRFFTHNPTPKEEIADE